jgi:YbbR domain-containing protein
MLVILSLILSFSLWIFVTNEENPAQIGTLPETLAVSPVNVPAGLDLLTGIEPIRVRLSAPKDMWTGLDANDFEAEVDLGGLDAGIQEVPVRVKAKDARVQVMEVIPPLINVELATLGERVVPVKVNLQGSPPIGYEAKLAVSEPAEVTVRGPEPLVGQIDSAVAEVDLDGAKVDLRRSFRLVPHTIRGYEVEGVILEPSSALILVSIEQQIQFRNLVVSPVLTGQVAPGFRVVAVDVEPVNVTVGGPPQAIQDVDYVETRPIELNEASESFSKSVALKLPPDLSSVGPRRVTVSITIGSLTASSRLYFDYTGEG